MRKKKACPVGSFCDWRISRKYRSGYFCQYLCKSNAVFSSQFSSHKINTFFINLRVLYLPTSIAVQNLELTSRIQKLRYYRLDRSEVPAEKSRQNTPNSASTSSNHTHSIPLPKYRHIILLFIRRTGLLTALSSHE